jgi:chromosome segregation ATPase
MPVEEPSDKAAPAVEMQRAHARHQRDIAKFRKEAAVESAKAAKMFEKNKKYKMKASKCTAYAVECRKKISIYQQKSEIELAKAKEHKDELDTAPEDKREHIKVKIAKHEHRSAKYLRKMESLEAKAMKLNEKAAGHNETAAEYLEKRKEHEARARELTQCADTLEKSGYNA